MARPLRRMFVQSNALEGDVMKLVGILCLIAGILAFTYGGFSYMKTTKVIDAGPVQISSHWRENVPLPPVIGITMMIAGTAILVAGSRRRA